MKLQIVELHYTSRPALDVAAIAARAAEILAGAVDAPRPLPEAPGVQLLVHAAAATNDDGTTTPVQTALLHHNSPANVEHYANEIQQSWQCPDAETLLRASTGAVIVAELMATSVAPAERMRLFHGVLQAVIELAEPHVLVFRHSQQVLAPATYMEAAGSSPAQRPGAVNVRYFQLGDTADEMVMDTRGLDAVGLPDLQCHFRLLKPAEVARVLFNTAIYLVESGPVIESGHTVPGIGLNARMGCRFEDSLLGPDRPVIDLDPGPPFAAGKPM